jgi:hypothetical protein
MRDQIISFKASKLAKEKMFFDKNVSGGVRISQDFVYFDDGTLHETKEFLNDDFFKIPIIYNAPTQSLVQKWLREEHGIAIMICTESTNDWIYKIASLNPESSYNGNLIISDSKNSFPIYEQALEEAIIKAFEFI